ncbi:MAG: polysaccharide deacetylase family protein [Coriobacteriia bacterium]|nr:polysaccharide deacetylase family protein [Coriobacteriia bacterium]
MTRSARKLIRDYAYRHVGGAALVLLYHRVADLDWDPQQLAVSRDNFVAQMRILSRRYRVLPLQELVDGLRRRRVPDGAIAVTFDDGYADNLHNAAPALAEFSVPATVFVSSGFVGAAREFWWDELDCIVLSPGTLPVEIELAVGRARFSAILAESHQHSAADASQDVSWSVEDPGGTERQRLYRELCAFVRPLPADDRTEALAQLRAAANAPAHARSGHLPLSTTDVRTLASHPYVDLGGHTVSHQMLSARSADEQRIEIAADRAALAEMLGHAPRLFSYPYGSLDSYTAETVDIVRETGYEGACSNHPGVVKPWTDPYRIPRYLVRDWDAETLAERIDGWFDDPQ